ncbi:hypothetical protein KIH27_18490 [Mycobacterium sp. M1]|uniref:DUF4143 domain-containing protein n=1 Tax=Mycolicibacter acidiphilus TaxID=2835306 RepID=A0ABS5RMN6_9MYCO|nr:hypothetical protein [Mycolicibacter acidiphilus]MBS9535578.1 hypothetical protein [Mycolicibacter acidiphilus]
MVMNDPLLAYLPSTLRHQHQRRAAHVKAQLAGAPTAAEQPTGPAAHAFAEAAQSAAANCDRLLGLLSPQAAITQWYNIDSRTRAALEHIKGLDRMRWVLAVAARGTSTDQQHVDEFFTNAAQWCAAKLHEGSYQVPVSGDPHWDLSVGAMPQRQFVERISSVGIRYHWACKAIATQIARIVSDDCAFAAELPELTVDNVERLFTTVRNHNDGDPLIPHDQSPALAVLMAVDSGALGGRPFAEMAISTKMRTQPWVRFADGLIPARDLLLFALERPLLAIVDARVGPLKRKKVTKGELYERVVQACIQGAIGRGCRDFPREYSITPEGGRERDIDFALIDTEVRVVGEVKAGVSWLV